MLNGDDECTPRCYANDSERWYAMETLMGIERKAKVCEICGKPSENTICDDCEQRIQGEAIGDMEEETKQEEGEIPE